MSQSRDVFLWLETLIAPYLYAFFRLLFGTLYPAYASYKAVRTKNVKEYVKWMMYWIVFALFCSIETFSDVFLSWLPFYYELKIIFVLWMLSPMTQGSSFLFKKFVHPQLARREKEIDEMIAQASKQGYTTLLSLGSKGITYASQIMMRTAIMGQSKLVDHLRRSYSTSDLSNDGHQLLPRHEAAGEEEGEDELDNRLREDNAELEVRSSNRGKLGRSKSAASASSYSLSSVKEETEGEGDEEEKVITETFTLPANTKKHYTAKEDNQQDEFKARSKSLPPSSGLQSPVSSALKKSADTVDIKKQQPFHQKEPPVTFLSQDESKSAAPIPRIIELKRNLFTKSHSQDNIIIRRGKAQVLSGLSNERKRELLKRAQSEEPSVPRQNSWQRPLSPLVSKNERWKFQTTVKQSDEAVQSVGAIKISEPLLKDEKRKSEISRTQLRSAIQGQENTSLPLRCDRSPISVSSKQDVSEWQIIDDSEESIESLDSPTADILYIDAEESPDDESIRSFDSNSQKEDMSISDITNNFSKERDKSSSPKLSLDHNIRFASELSTSEDEDGYSISDSSETVGSLTPENVESEWFSETDDEIVPDLFSPCGSRSMETVSLQCSSQSLPGSLFTSRESWFEDIEEENHQSLSTPNSPYSEPKYSQYATRSSASRLRNEKIAQGKKPLIRQAIESAAITPSGSFDPFRSWSSYTVPSSTTRPATTSPSTQLQSSGHSEKRLYTRSYSVDSRDSWFNTYPRSAMNVGHILRDQGRSRSVSVEKESLPLYRFRQLSQDPSQINLKAKK